MTHLKDISSLFIFLARTWGHKSRCIIK